MSPQKAILIPANPFKFYRVTPTRETKDLGDVEFHREHLYRNRGVFWDLVPPGRRDAPWRHPEINSGYFYISKAQVVRYWMSIEYIRRWKEIDLGKVERYIPEPRRAYLESYPETLYYYAILIRDIHRLEPERELKEFRLASMNKKVELVRNYAIIIDPGWR